MRPSSRDPVHRDRRPVAGGISGPGRECRVPEFLLRRFEIIGEAARRLSDETRASLPQLPWEAMIGMRNLPIHEYDGVDLDVVWETIHADLPTLAQTIQSLVPPDV